MKTKHNFALLYSQKEIKISHMYLPIFKNIVYIKRYLAQSVYKRALYRLLYILFPIRRRKNIFSVPASILFNNNKNIAYMRKNQPIFVVKFVNV